MHVGQWLVEVDKEACIGSGVCASSVPGHFQVVDGKSRPIESEVAPDEELIDVAELCPMAAIHVVDRVTGAELAPEPDDE